MSLPWISNSRTLAAFVCLLLVLSLALYHVFGNGGLPFTLPQVPLVQDHDGGDPSQDTRLKQDQRLAFLSHTQNGVPVYDGSDPSSPPRFLSHHVAQQPETVPASTLETTEVIRSHPRLFADSTKWEELPDLVRNDAYLGSWNKTIFELAREGLEQPPPIYVVDGTNGVLDIAREVQLRIKLWSYAYRISGGGARWKERIWEELLVTSGNSTQGFGLEGDRWNAGHWLDVAEFLIAFSFAYDWLYDAWNEVERDAIMWSIIDLGLKKGLEAHEQNAWFLSVKGNWNCVTNGAMIIGALAVYHEDPTNISRELLPLAIDNALNHCAQSVESDGTWTETPDYWYFGTQAHAQLSSALLAATGSTHGMLTASPAFRETGMFHIYNYGMTEKFNYGDCGPPKFTATANALLFYGNEYSQPVYTLYQRDRPDAADPLAMLWYDPAIAGSWYHQLPLDREFSDPRGAWVSMRSSWTDPYGLFVAMKAGRMVGHATHGNLDAGDFVLDAMGERWAGELCQENYNAPEYFSSEKQDSVRWSYYRCRTEGQNTIVYGGGNQVADAVPQTQFGSMPNGHWKPEQLDGGPFWIADLTNAYNGTSIRRGVKLVGDRKQVMLQDEIRGADKPSQWRMHTNATVTYSENGKRAHLRLNGRKMDVLLASPPTASFHATVAARLASNSPVFPEGYTEMGNPHVNVLAVDLPLGDSTVVVVFCPQWESGSACETASYAEVVPLERWRAL